jgi:hypothetical protein
MIYPLDGICRSLEVMVVSDSRKLFLLGEVELLMNEGACPHARQELVLRSG